MKVFLLFCVAAGIVIAGFVYNRPWLAGVGLLVGFSAMWVDHGHVSLDRDEQRKEASMEVRKMRGKRKA